MSQLAILMALGFLAGALPFAVWVGQLKGVDIRSHGSGNPGAANVGRTLGWGWGGLVLLLDAFKAAVPTWFALQMIGSLGGVLTAVAAILGHSFSPFLRFKGGKGVASALGALLVLSPMAAGCSLAVYAVVLAWSRIASLSSLTAALALPLVLWLIGADRILLTFGSTIALLVIVRHRANLHRLLRGEEPRLGRKAKEPIQR